MCFSIVSDESAAYQFLQILMVRLFVHTMEIKKTRRDRVTRVAIIELRERFQLLSREIIVLRSRFREQIKVTIPQLGDKKQILDLSIRNAKFYRIEQLKQLQIVDPDRHANQSWHSKDLRLPVEPRHIECFDNSNIQGTKWLLCGI
jgi:excinuclease ABC subunit C